MTRTASLIGLGLGLAFLAGCAAPEPQTQAERELAACRTDANRLDNQENRLDLAQRDTSTTPLSADGMPGINTQPIIERSVHDREVLDCLNGTGSLPVK
jgi:hypothetical protein